MEGQQQASTGDRRREILAMLCISNRTVSELARELGISNTAVRSHLVLLEEEGLVHHERVRRGVGKPAHEYCITAAGESLLSRAHLPLLRQLLEVLESELPAAAVESVLRKAGRRLAPAPPGRSGSARTRAEAAAALLRELGGLAFVSEGGSSIRCRCCAIAALVVDHPLACKAMEAMLAEYLDTPVHEWCDRGARPQCRFEIEQPNQPG